MKNGPFFDNKVCKSQWLSSGQMPVPMPKAELHPGEVMLSIWWYISGVWFIWRYQKQSHNLLHPLLNPALQWKHPSLVNSRGTILHQVMPVPTVQTNPEKKKEEVINSAIKYVYFLHIYITLLSGTPNTYHKPRCEISTISSNTEITIKKGTNKRYQQFQ